MTNKVKKLPISGYSAKTLPDGSVDSSVEARKTLVEELKVQ